MGRAKKPVIFRDCEVEIEKLYIGRDGCRCGCGGTYIYGINSIKKHLKENKEKFDSAQVHGIGKERWAEIRLGTYANGDPKYATLYFAYTFNIY